MAGLWIKTLNVRLLEKLWSKDTSMKGSVQKKGKIFYAVVALGRKRKWFRAGPEIADARRVLAEKLAEIRKGTFKETPRATFRQFSEIWLRKYAEINVKPSTLLTYQDVIRRLLIPSWGRLPLSSLTPLHFQEFVSERFKAVKPKTVLNEVQLVKAIFKRAVIWGYLEANPAEHLERPKAVRPEIEILNPDEMEKLLAHSTRHYRTAFLTAVLTGLRAGELWALQWQDVDWSSLKIFVRRSLWKGKFQTPKSKYSVRKVDIPEHLAQELKRWKLLSPKNEHDLVFPDPRGKPISHGGIVKRHFEPALKRAGLRHVSFHSLRHTNASIRIASGQNIKYIQHQLGHSSIKITLDVYGHLFVDPDFNRRQVRLLESSLGSVRSSDVKTPLLVAGSMSP
jgi:integrase